MGVVPTVVEEEGVELDVAGDGELPAEGVDAVERAGFVEAVSVTEVEPGVVMEEGPIGTRALVLNIGEEGAAELAGRRGADDGGVCDALAGTQGEIAEEGGRDLSVLHGIAGERMLEAIEHVGIDDGGTFDGAVDVGGGVGELKQADFGEREILGGRGDGE